MNIIMLLMLDSIINIIMLLRVVSTINNYKGWSNMRGVKKIWPTRIFHKWEVMGY